jgi:hypothetical protein
MRCGVRPRWIVRLNHVEEWLLGLDGGSYELVVAALELLEERGPTLGRPLVDRIHESRHQNMKELRPGSSGRSELRILFAPDRSREAIPLVAGDKAGHWLRWYREAIPEADRLLDRHNASRWEEGDRG